MDDIDQKQAEVIERMRIYLESAPDKESAKRKILPLIGLTNTRSVERYFTDRNANVPPKKRPHLIPKFEEFLRNELQNGEQRAAIDLSHGAAEQAMRDRDNALKRDFRTRYVSELKDIQWAIEAPLPKAKRAQMEMSLASCFPASSDVFRCDFSKNIHRKYSKHREWFIHLPEWLEQLNNQSIRVIVPRISNWCHCVLQFMQDYFDLSKLAIDQTEVSQTAVDLVNHDARADFIVAAGITVCMGANDRGRKYRFGSELYNLDQSVAIHGNADWKSQEVLPIYYLQNATGHLDFLKFQHQCERIRRDPDSTETRPRIIDKGVDHPKDILHQLHNADPDEVFSVSLWEPLLSYYVDRGYLHTKAISSDHLLAFFFHRDSTVDEFAFYNLYTYSELLLSKRGIPVDYLSNAVPGLHSSDSR